MKKAAVTKAVAKRPLAKQAAAGKPAARKKAATKRPASWKRMPREAADDRPVFPLRASKTSDKPVPVKAARPAAAPAKSRPSTAGVKQLSPEEAVAHIQALLDAKHERDKQGPSWPGAGQQAQPKGDVAVPVPASPELPSDAGHTFIPVRDPNQGSKS